MREGAVVLRNQLWRVFLLLQYQNSLVEGKPMARQDPAQRLPVTDHVYENGDGVLIPKQRRDLLGTLSHVHLASWQSERNLPLPRLATHAEFRDVQLPRLRAYALVSDGFGGETLTAPADQPFSRPLNLKRSRPQVCLRKLRSRAILKRSQRGLHGQHHA
ncbi:hypothetical protein ACWGS9_30925 [Bradyrhizobium sp. Arg314]